MRLREDDAAPGCLPGFRPDPTRDERFFAGCFAHGASDDGGRDEFDESCPSRCSNSAIRRSRCSNAVSKSRTRTSNCSTTASNDPDSATPRSSQTGLNPPTTTANQLNSYGWAMADNYKTPLISAAIAMAARTHVISDGAIFHSDRGTNYTSVEFAETLDKFGMRQSVGRTGICYDNAMSESFFAILKNELVHRTEYPTLEHARNDIAQYIELRYNTNRIHSGLNYKTPHEVHIEYLNKQQTA
jgi:hypothetical protein